jgi:hypothetical protein
MSPLSKRIWSILGNALCLLDKVALDRLLNINDSESSRFDVFREYRRCGAEELISYRDILIERDSSIALGIVLWRMTHEGLTWDNSWKRVFRSCDLNGYTDNIINVARLGAGKEDRVDVLKPLRKDWEEMEALLASEDLTYSGIGKFDLGGIIEYLNVWGEYLKASSALTVVRSRIRSLLKDTARFNDSVELSIGPLLLLFYDLDWKEKEDLDLLFSLKRNYGQLTGREYSGVTAAYHSFGGAIRPLALESGLDRDTLWLLEYILGYGSDSFCPP